MRLNQDAQNLLGQSHEYTSSIGGQQVQVSVQMYQSVLRHFRLFVFARTEKAHGMLFSLNFTTSKDAEGIIALSQKLRFGEGRGLDRAEAKHIRLAKAKLLADILVRCGFDVTDNMEIQLGMYDSRRHRFLNTTSAKFLSQLLVVALLKGHFQGNKGYQFSAMPRFDNSFPWRYNTSTDILKKLIPNRQGIAGQRSIPLSLRYHVLVRDNSKCCRCGRSPKDSVILHVDHIVPFSVGGLSVLENLQTLCSECNLGKGNRWQQ